GTADGALHGRGSQRLTEVPQQFAQGADRTNRSAAHPRKAGSESERKTVDYRFVRWRDRVRPRFRASSIVQQVLQDKDASLPAAIQAVIQLMVVLLLRIQTHCTIAAT